MSSTQDREDSNTGAAMGPRVPNLPPAPIGFVTTMPPNSPFVAASPQQIPFQQYHMPYYPYQPAPAQGYNFGNTHHPFAQQQRPGFGINYQYQQPDYQGWPGFEQGQLLDESWVNGESRRLQQVSTTQQPDNRLLSIGNIGLLTIGGPGFNRRPMEYFRAGRIFESEWPEHMGDDLSMSSASSQQYHSKLYKFVIIQRRRDIVITVRIHTYGGQGAGCKQRSDHCIVYTGESPPEPFDDEKPQPGRGGIKTKAVRVTPNDRGGFLREGSRLNLGRPIPVDVKSRLRDWGWVHADSFKDLKDMYKEVDRFWESQNSKPG